MITITATMTVIMIITITRRLLTWSTLVVTQCAWASTLSSHPVFTFYTDTLLFLFHISYFVSSDTVLVFRISFGLNFLSRLYQCKCLYFVCSIGKVWYNFHKHPCDAFLYFVFVVICLTYLYVLMRTLQHHLMGGKRKGHGLVFSSYSPQPPPRFNSTVMENLSRCLLPRHPLVGLTQHNSDSLVRDKMKHQTYQSACPEEFF